MKDNKYFRRIVWGLLTIAVLPGFVSCEDDDAVYEREITAFKITVGSDVFSGSAISEDTIAFKIAPDYDIQKLDGAVATVYASGYTSISPLPSIPQDFTKVVEYTLTSIDGVSKKWYVKWTYGDKLPEGAGLGYWSKRWYKTADELGQESETSIGICGKYVVLAGTGKLFDRETGASVSGKLNIEGTAGMPASLANDSEGNMIGVVNTGGASVIYKWTAVDAAPVQVVSLPGINATKETRIRGDINGDAYITATAPQGPNGDHYRFKVTDGVVDPNYTVISTGLKSNDGAWVQTLSAVDATENTIYYIADPFNTSSADMTSNMYYMKNGVVTGFNGPVGWPDYPPGASNWGHYTNETVHAFRFNGGIYALAVTMGWNANYVTLIDGNNNNSVVFWEVYPFGAEGHPNVAVQMDKEEDALYVCAIMFKTGIVCYKLTRYEK